MNKWEKHEKTQARKTGSTTTSGSGNGKLDKGDFKNDKFRVECKYTDAASFILKKQILDKIHREAALTGRHPALSISIQGDVYYVIPEDVALEIEGLCTT